MDLTGRIIQVLPERSGTSQRTGTEWKMASYVMETAGDFPRKMCFEVFGSDRIAALNIQMGELLTVSFDIDAREYNGRWYNQIRAFKVDRGTATQQPAAAVQPPFGQPAPAAAPFGAQPQQPVAAPFPPQQPTMNAMGEDEQLPF